LDISGGAWISSLFGLAAPGRNDGVVDLKTGS